MPSLAIHGNGVWLPYKQLFKVFDFNYYFNLFFYCFYMGFLPEIKLFYFYYSNDSLRYIECCFYWNKVSEFINSKENREKYKIKISLNKLQAVSTEWCFKNVIESLNDCFPITEKIIKFLTTLGRKKCTSPKCPQNKHDPLLNECSEKQHLANPRRCEITILKWNVGNVRFLGFQV